MAENYILRVTAGATYELDKHVEVPVNTAEPLRISSELMDLELNVRIQNYRGLPRASPSSSPYFDAAPHDYNKDLYSIAFRFTPKDPDSSSSSSSSAPSVQDGGDNGDRTDGETNATNGASGSSSSNSSSSDSDSDSTSDSRRGISGTDLQFGNDFDHPIRDRLPPGFGTAMNIVKWWIDPGLEGDAYADEPYLYGPALSSFNAVRVGAGVHDPERGGLWFEEGGDGEEELGLRREAGAPDDGKKRMKWALAKASKERWVWEFGRTYGVDFYNPYVDFNQFALRLPGFTLPVIRYWDGQPLSSGSEESAGQFQPKRSHQLRYVLRNRATGHTYLVVLFTLYLKDDVNEDGSLKPAAIAATKKPGAHPAVDTNGQAEAESGSGAHANGDGFNSEKALEEARKKFAETGISGENAGDEAEIDEVDEGVD